MNAGHGVGWGCLREVSIPKTKEQLTVYEVPHGTQEPLIGYWPTLLMYDLGKGPVSLRFGKSRW